MQIAFKPRTPLKLPEENPLIAAIKKRLLEFRTELGTLWNHFDSRFRAEKERIDAKLREADAILADAKKVKDGRTPTEEELTELIQRYIPEVEDGKTPTEAELTALILQYMPEPVHGKTPTEAELLALIRPLIPKVKDGRNPTDRELLKLIKPLILAPVRDEKGKDGTDITPEQIKAKLRELPIKGAWFDYRHILGLEDLIRNRTSGLTLGGRGGGGGGATQLTATGNVNGVNTDFTFTEKPTYIVSDGIQYRENFGWTFSGLTATMSIPPQYDVYAIQI